MRNSRKAIFALSAAAMAALSVHTAKATTITEWTFGGTGEAKGVITSSPAPVVGSGTASSLGMTNSYTYVGGEGPGSVDGSNMTTVKSAAFSTFSETTWKIVGNGNTVNSGAGIANGWNNSAPNFTQGAEFALSTVGFGGLDLSFDWFSTTQGVGNLAVQYTDDVTQATPVWTTAGGNAQGDFVALGNDFFGATSGGVTSPNITVAIPADANNDANFAVRLVSVRPVTGDSDFSSTGPGTDGAYASASGDSSSATAVDYNNSSGNWSFDNIALSGTAVPEPASLGLLAVAGLGLLARRRAKSST